MSLVPRRGRRGAGAMALVCALSIAAAGVSAQQDEIRARIKEAASLLGKRAATDALKILEPLASEPAVTGNPALLGDVQFHTGNARFILNEYPKAIEYFERARESSRNAGDRTSEARAFFREAQAHKNIGQYDVALEEARQAVALYDAVSNRALTASSWTVVGGIQDLMGRYRDALQSYETASRLFEGTNAPAANSLYNETAITYKNLGDYDRALVFYGRALDGHIATGDRYSQGVTLLNIGNVHSILGDDDRALEYYARALEISKSLNERRGQSILLGNIASVLADRGELARATEYTLQQLELARVLGSKNEEGLALKNLGDLHTLREEFEPAERRYQEALTIQREIGARGREGSTLLALADLRVKQRSPAEAAALAGEVLTIARELSSPDLEWRAAHTAGRAARDGGQLESAVASLRVSAAIINDLRANVTSDSGKIGFLDRRQEVFQDLAIVLFKASRPEEALEAAEAGRARAFADLLSQRQVEGKPSDRQQLTAVRTALNDLHASNRVPAVQPGRTRTDAARDGALDKSLAALRDTSRELTSLLTAESPTRAEIAQIARRVKATLVEYLVTEQALLVWVVMPSGDIHASSVDAGRQRLERLVEEFCKVTASAQDLSSPAPRRYLTLARELDQLLIAPIAHWLPTSPDAPVVIVPHGPLPVLPFAVLRDRRGRTLVSRHTLASAPAISVYRYTGDRPSTAASPSALVIADPVTPKEAGLPALAGARAEGGMVARRLGPDVEWLSGKGASEAAVKQRAPGRRFLHFATHGVIAADRPLASSLLLTPGDGEDGYLRVDEVFGLSLAADLIVLSGCSTGLGRPSGDGIIGLSRAFLYAGTPTVVVSQWDVSDRTTAFLMDRFYAALGAGRTPAAALRAAQLATSARYSHPALWGAFVLVGEPGLSERD